MSRGSHNIRYLRKFNISYCRYWLRGEREHRRRRVRVAHADDNVRGGRQRAGGRQRRQGLQGQGRGRGPPRPRPWPRVSRRSKLHSDIVAELTEETKEKAKKSRQTCRPIKLLMASSVNPAGTARVEESVQAASPASTAAAAPASAAATKAAKVTNRTPGNIGICGAVRYYGRRAGGNGGKAPSTKKFKVAIAIGHGKQSGIIHTGQIFPSGCVCFVIGAAPSPPLPPPPTTGHRATSSVPDIKTGCGTTRTRTQIHTR